MDYMGWELERQRSALLALLGGGEPEGEDASGEAPSGWEGPSGWGDKAPADGTRRSPAEPGTARTRVPGRAGRYAAKREEAGGPLVGAPGAWELVREAERGAPAGESGGPEPPEDAEFSYGEAEFPDRDAEFPARGSRSAETGVPAVPRRKPAEEVWRTSRSGTGGAAEFWTPSGGRGDGGAERERAEGLTAETKRAAGTAGERRAGGDPAGGDPAAKTGGGARFAESDGLAKAADRRERMLRVLPWAGRESAVLRAEDGARALSRAVQRDARRYDGGFTIY